ncbi:Hypothetical predicted protein [Olea europaea subsp. europaea]|uniref:Uncharacterized protein n=1 Tax=Olea europaea subsp. europaea TaxID=158383 RepID=A0A8S0UTX7_OLEEU|nr:Hypothetical predicted protein [Olea europaea subsp. europaea]
MVFFILNLSCSYVVRDIAVALDLVAIALHFNSWTSGLCIGFHRGQFSGQFLLLAMIVGMGASPRISISIISWDTSCILPFLYRTMDVAREDLQESGFVNQIPQIRSPFSPVCISPVSDKESREERFTLQSLQ